MRLLRSVLLVWLLSVAVDSGAPPSLIIVNDFGDGGPGNCTTTCTLRDAIAVALASDPIKGVGFSAAGGWPQTITLTQGKLSINNTSGSILSVTGPGAAKLAISANNLSRVLEVSAGSSVVSDLTLRDGMVAGVSPGPQGDFTGSAGQDGGAAIGGCIAIDASATLTLDRSDVSNCIALGGTGGTGGSGSFGGFMGGAGGTGGTIFGGCINVAAGATMALDQVDVRHCAGTGGNGGKGGRGGDGSPGRGGDSGAGGAGAQASGGAIYAAGNLTLLRSSVALSNATGGDGGASDFAGAGSHIDGNGGSGGPGGVAAGGAVYVASSGTALIRNTTLAGDIAAGGHGGSGGSGGNASSGGNGGAGGLALGGLLQSEGPSSVVDVEFTTFANGAATGGPGGSAGSGSTAGIPGTPGDLHGAAISAGGSVTIKSAVVVGAAAAALCFGNVGAAPGAANLDQDSSCPGFTLHGSFEQTLLPLSLATTSWPAYMPVYHGAAIDASASCTQIDGVIAVPDDQHGTLRPQGGACDLGAIETDYLFVGTFD